MDLTVVSVICNNKSTGFLSTMLDSVNHFTDFKPNIILVDNGDNGKTVENLKKEENIVILKGLRKKMPKSSLAHGQGLNLALPKVKTEFTAIVEQDCAVLDNRWYEFDTQKYDVMASYKGRCAGLDYHYVCFMVYRSNILNDIDWRPLYDDAGSRTRLYNDCGWRAEEKLASMKERIYNIQSRGVQDATFFSSPAFSYKTKELWDIDDDFIRAVHFFRGADLTRRKIHNNISHKKQVKEFRDIVKKIMESKSEP